jgi:hypothetical protein
MTKPRTRGLFLLVPTRGTQQGCVGKLSLSRMACIVLVFCAAAAISLPAQTLTTLATFDITNGAYP